MRILHTADWHLGIKLRDFTRETEHKLFLDWLIDCLESEKIDLLLMTGDVFDTANPSSQSLSLYYNFMAEAKKRLSHLKMLFIAGNHDSATRLEASTKLLKSLDINIVTKIHYLENGKIDYSKLIFNYADLMIAAVPFLRMIDLPELSIDQAPVEGLKRVYKDVIQQVNNICEKQTFILTGHFTMAGAKLSLDSERQIHGSIDNEVPDSLFDDSIDYLALGHLHLPQAVSGREHIRYSGSPFPLSITERNYEHQVVILDTNNPKTHQIINIPRFVEMKRIPENHQALDDIIPLINDLKNKSNEDNPELYPWLEVRVLIDGNKPGLRDQIAELLKNKAVRLVRLNIKQLASTDDNPEISVNRELKEIKPEEIFSNCYFDKFGEEVPSKWMTAFLELMSEVNEEGS